MALCAIIRQCFLVDIGVTGYAFPAEPQISIIPFFQFPVADIIRLVALATIYRCMLSLQVVSGQRMVEPVLVKTYDVEITTMMVAVAGDALFPFRLPGCMKSRSPVNPAFNFIMATQALIIGNLISQNMAFRAVRYPFQVGVHFGQITRRQLRTRL